MLADAFTKEMISHWLVFCISCGRQQSASRGHYQDARIEILWNFYSYMYQACKEVDTIKVKITELTDKLSSPDSMCSLCGTGPRHSFELPVKGKERKGTLFKCLVVLALEH